MSDLPDWIYEGAEVWLLRSRGGWSHTPDPQKAQVLRFTAQSIVVAALNDAKERSFAKANLRGVGAASDYELVNGDHEKVIKAHRTAAVRAAMRQLRGVFNQMQFGNRIDWDELPNALEAAHLFHEASFEAIQGLEEAREHYGAGERRDTRR